MLAQERDGRHPAGASPSPEALSQAIKRFTEAVTEYVTGQIRALDRLHEAIDRASESLKRLDSEPGEGAPDA